MSTEETRAVVVIGAGVSGLYAAYCLKQEGVDVVLLEGRSRVGGRNQTFRDSKLGYADMGAAYTGPTQTKLLEVLSKLGIQPYPTPIHGKSLLWFEGERIPFTDSDIPLRHMIAGMDVANVLLTVDKYSLQVPLEDPWNAARAQEWDSMTITEFVNKTCWTRLARMSINIGFHSVFGRSGDDISFLYALHTVRSCGGIHALFGSRRGLQEMKIAGGSDTICQQLAARLGDSVKLSCHVAGIEQRTDCVIVKTASGLQYKAQQVIVAIHPLLVDRLQFSPPLPERLKKISSIPSVASHGFKTSMFYEKPYWREQGLSGEFVSEEGPIYYALDDTKPGSKYATLMGFMDDHYENMQPAERQKLISQQYAKVLGISALEQPVGYLEKNWKRAGDGVYTCDCVWCFTPGTLTSIKRFWGEAFDRVHFAGAETSPVFRGYMDGGLRSAERVTVEVLKQLNVPARQQYDTRVRQVSYQQAPAIERYVPSIGQLITGAVALAIAALALVLNYAL